ncbi:DUF6362 family protein [Acetobacter nitrogenifigens]|uniref:DUF6362 family protein n=3 Tax=Acetobacter nitrogenifigens TaxID=285268 RepID=UPI00042A73B5|nr:DUF6362 family protein [Acetobacter nitrogenifigens]
MMRDSKVPAPCDPGEFVDVSALAFRSRKPTEFSTLRPVVDQVAEWLEEAATTLATLHVKNLRPAGVKINWPDIVMDRKDLDWFRASDDILPSPTADAVARMDIVLGWPGLLVDMGQRTVVNKRLIVNPYSGKYLWEWRPLGRHLGVDYKTAQAWHRRACEVIGKKFS